MSPKKIYNLRLVPEDDGSTLQEAALINCICCKECLSGCGGNGMFICGECVEALSRPLKLGPRPLSPAEVEEYGVCLEDDED